MAENILNLQMAVPNDATRLAEIANAVARRTPAEALYATFMEQAKDAAEHAVRSVQVPILKLSKYRALYENMKMQGAKLEQTQDEFCDEHYKAQNQMVEMLKQNGFKVTVKEMSNLILPNAAQPKNTDLEAIAIVEW